MIDFLSRLLFQIIRGSQQQKIPLFSQSLYRIVLMEAPLPIERFIANFCSEVPLPPPGRIQVRFGFVSRMDGIMHACQVILYLCVCVCVCCTNSRSSRCNTHNIKTIPRLPTRSGPSNDHQKMFYPWPISLFVHFLHLFLSQMSWLCSGVSCKKRKLPCYHDTMHSLLLLQKRSCLYYFLYGGKVSISQSCRMLCWTSSIHLSHTS